MTVGLHQAVSRDRLRRVAFLLAVTGNAGWGLGCGPSASTATGSGGASASGGAPGSGGAAPGTGGANSGGVTASGGASATGGVSASGGASGTGGSSGGSTATGGRGSGGAGGSGGRGGGAGTATGGRAATGGATGGASATGGVAGGGGPAGGSTGAVVKGVAFYEPSAAAATCADLDTLKAGWFYNWTTGTSCKPAKTEFVPQIGKGWSTTGTNPAIAVAAKYKVVLGFNEPDHADQANMSVAQVLTLWPLMDQPGLRLGSPATASDGQVWFEQFMTGVQQQNLRVDFIALHWYGWNAGSCANVTQLETYIKWAEKWGKPLWLTEWSCRQQSATVTQAFYDSAVAMFAKHPLVERYAWYLTRSSGDFAGGALLDSTGAPTPLGTDYAAR